VVANWPDSEDALWAQADLIKSYLAAGDDPNAENAVEKLLADFSENPLIARAIHDTAYEYRKLEKYDRADELDQFVIDKWPADTQAMWAKMDMAKTNVRLGNDAAVEAAIDSLIADFNDNPEVATAVFNVGEEYYNSAFQAENQGLSEQSQEYFRKAIAVWERVIEEVLVDAMVTPDAYYFSAICYRRLGQYEKAIEYCQLIVENWPTYTRAWHAQFMIGRCYERLEHKGAIPHSEAVLRIRDAYKNFLERYPDRPMARIAQNWLDQIRGYEGE
jgi:tetratricopeptide (TPR) repeat protein